MSNPNRRRRPVWCGDVDTTRPGGAWDVQDDGCCGPCKPPVPGCGPGRPPMPQFPDCGYHIPPVQYVPGMNEQEQLANLNHKMNELIELFNCNTDKVYGAYEEVVRSAVCNDAFYKEITVESGYLADASTSYELVHIPFVDCGGQPIYMEMGLAYNNTTNSGVTESVFDKALEVYADKILPAAERGFQGVAIWKGAPIYSGADAVGTMALIPGECDYTLGVTENGYFKIYDTPNDKDNSGMIKAMRQDKVRNSMGCAVIIRGGEYVVDGNLSDMELPCTVMAMNYKTKERFILAIGKDNVASDITPEMIANLLKKYDVDVAALTSWGQQSYLLDKGQFSFMPTSTDSDGIPTVPQSAAFWYITKRRNFHNDYVKEVAALTIQMGENLWYDELTSEAVDNLKLDFVDLRNDLEQEIQDRKDADDALGERIDKEIADREAADTALDEKYAAEVARLDEEIETLGQRVTTEVARLDELIQSTKAELTAKDVKRVKVTHDGTRDTYQVELNDGTVLGADVIVYNYDQLVQKLDSYATVEQRLNAEIEARKSADDALIALITAEQQARANGDTALAEQIEGVRAELSELIQGNTTDITALQGALDTLTQTVQSNYASLNERVTSNAENIANLQGSYGALQATVAALNETVTGLQQSFASTEQSFENVKQTVNEIQTELNQFEARVEEQLGNYLPLSGGTMDGDIDLNYNDLLKVGAINLNTTTTRTPNSIMRDPNGFSFVSADSNRYARLNFWSARMASSADIAENIDIIPEQGGILNFKFKGVNTVLLRGVRTPEGNTDAANKQYVDNALKGYLPLTGGTVSGEVIFNDNITIGSRDSVYFRDANDAVAARMYYDNTLKSISIQSRTTPEQNIYMGVGNGIQVLSGGNILYVGDVKDLTDIGNPIGIGSRRSSRLEQFYVGDPVNDYAAANKKYVDTVGSNLAEEISTVGGQFSNYLPLTGGTLTGPLDIAQSGAVPSKDGLYHYAANAYAFYSYYVGDERPARKFARFGVGEPVDDSHATTKKYVDTVSSNLAKTVVKVKNLPWSKGVFDSVNNFIVNEQLITEFGISNNTNGHGANLTTSGLQVVDGSNANHYVTGVVEANTFYITGKNDGYSTRVTDAGIFISYAPANNDSVPRIYGRAVQSNQSIKHAICFSEDGGFNPTDNFTRLIGIDYPVNEHDAAPKGYVDAADEGFLYVDGGRLYAHGDTPQDVLLDRLDFAPGGVESGGIVSLDCVAGSAGPILSVSDGDSGLALLQAKTSDFSSNDDVMTLGAVAKLGNDDYPYTEPMLATYKVTSGGSITGAYLLRSPQGLWAINISGSQEESFGHNEARLIGDTIDITVAVDDATSMTITFSQAVNAISISKVIGIAPLTIEGVS